MDRSALVVADDLTGASDTGHQFARRGYRTTIATRDDADPDPASVAVVNTDSRYAAPADAAERVRRAVDRYPASVVYKKVDSTLRGNLVAEIEACLGASEAPLALVAPAFPATGRLTVAGIHLVDGIPVTETKAGRDPDAPVESAHIPSLLDDGSFDVAHVPITDLAEGEAALAGRLRELADRPDPTAVVCDATAEDHLATLAGAGAALERQMAYVGSGGLARHVRIDDEAADGVLGVVGSASTQTFEQLSALPDEEVVVLDGERAVTELEAVVEETTDRACNGLADRSRAVVTAAREPADVDRTLVAGTAAGLTERETRDRIASALGRTAAAVADAHGVTGLFATGGAIATAVLEAVAADGIRLTGHEVTDGVPIGRVRGGRVAGTPIITKAGAFGDSDTIVKSLLSLEQYDDR